MTEDTVIQLVVGAVELALKVGLPLLLVGLAVGLVISVFQAITQIQEQSLVFIPKIVATAAVLIIAGPWMLDQMLVYAHDLYAGIGEMGAEGGR